MNLYLGIDGGGTKTKVVVINELEEIIYEQTSGPSSIDTVDNETTFNSFVEALKDFDKKMPNTTFKGVFAGLGGIVFEDDYTHVENIINQLDQVDIDTFIRARNDMENALYSGGNFDQGLSLICGTGMVAFGKNGELTHKCGGWGFKEGELGSGYNLGREAIRHTIRAYDNRYPMNDFAKDVAKAIEMRKATDIIHIMEDDYFGERTKTAQLAPIVTKHANLGNEYAREIVDKATYELALAVRGVYNTLKLSKTTLVIIGSLGNADGYFKDRLHEQIHEISPFIRIITSAYDPAYAAALMAKRLAG